MRVRVGQVAVILVSILVMVAVYQLWSAATEMWVALESVADEAPATPTRARERRHAAGTSADAAPSPTPAARRLSREDVERTRLAPIPDGELRPEPTRTPSSGHLREARARWREGLSDEALEAHRARRREQRQARSAEERSGRRGVEVRLREGAAGEGRVGELPDPGDTD